MVGSFWRAAALGMILGALWDSGVRGEVRIRAGADGTRVEVTATLTDEVQGRLPAGKLTAERGERWLRLSLVDRESGRDGPAMLGSYERQQSLLIFRPACPLVRGERYRATFGPGGGPSRVAEYRVPPRPPAPPARVERIYPSAAVLPANHLKFYIHFSKPMREGKDIFERIQLLDGDGQPIPDAWRHTELWNADARRLTLWIHPGRVKRGVNLREEFGPVLRPGREYTLVVGADLCDADGQALGRPFTRKFRTVAEDRTRPLVEPWKTRAPQAGTLRPLVLEFPKPLDRALLDRLIAVVDAHGKAVPGRIEVGAEERSWAFHPERPWESAEYTVSVDARLEDLAGNTPLRLFDTDLSEPSPPPPRLSWSFRPRGES
jgi:hypothetical protein